jgi:hypothetical protein
MTMIQSRCAYESRERWKHAGHEGFRQVRTSVRIITLRHVFWYIMIPWLRPSLYPSFYYLPDQDTVSICLFYKIYLLNIF